MAGNQLREQKGLLASFHDAIHNDRPLPTYVRNPSVTEQFVYLSSALLSIIAGVGLGIGMYVFDEQSLLVFSGLAHLFVFGGLLWFIRLTKYRALGYIMLCMLFPFWGAPLGLLGLYIFSALLCSIVWGAVLWYILEDNAPFYAFIGIGIIQPVSLLIVATQNDSQIPDWYLPAVVGYWHIASACCVVWLGYRYRRLLSGLSIVHCAECDYPLDGLDTIDACPECGKPRALPMFQSIKAASKLNADEPGSPDIELGGFSPDR